MDTRAADIASPWIAPSPQMITPPPVPGAAAAQPTSFIGAAAPEMGSAVEVVAVVHDSVIKVRHLTDPTAGTVRFSTWLLLGAGWGAFAAGAALAVAAHVGAALPVLFAGLAGGIFGLLRARDERTSPHFTLGRDESVDIPSLHHALPTRRFPLVEAVEGGYFVNLIAGMTGEMLLAGRTSDFETLVVEGRCRPSSTIPGASALALPAGARLRLVLGDAVFFVRTVDPGPRLRSALVGEADWRGQVCNGASLGAHAVVLALAFAVPADSGYIGFDRFGSDARLVKVTLTAPDARPDEVPAWLRRKAEDSGAAAPRARGDEGKAGSPTAKARNKRFAIKGDAKPEDHRAARELARESARSSGVLGILGRRTGGPLAALFGSDSAIGADTENAMGSLIGNDTGDSYGIGGAGIVGTGRGGGGLADGTVGVCSGAACQARIGSHLRPGVERARRVAVRTGPDHTASAPGVIKGGRAQVRGSLDREIVRRIIRQHLNEIRYCYQKELQGDASLGGRVVVGFTIGAQGTVLVSSIQSSTVGSPAVDRCIMSAVRRWTFPRPVGGGIVVVSYPFVLRSAGQ